MTVETGEGIDHFDPFAVPGTWSISLPCLPPLLDDGSLFSPLDLHLPSLKAGHDPTRWITKDNYFELPLLPAFAHNALPPVNDLAIDGSLFNLCSEGHPKSSPDALESGGQALKDGGVSDENAWCHPSALLTLKSETKVLTWSSFVNGQPLGPGKSAGLLSESGSRVFDEFLSSQARSAPNRAVEAGRVVRSGAFLDALFTLGLGGSSLLFPFDTNKDCFTRAAGNIRLSGYSYEASDSVITKFMDLGRAIRRLRRFEEESLSDSSACAARIALASVIGTVVNAIEEQLVQRKPEVNSLLKLQDLYERPRDVVSMISEILDRTARAYTDVDLASSLFEMLQHSEDCGEDNGLLQEVFARVSQPWMHNLEVQIGLRQDLYVSQSTSLPTAEGHAADSYEPTAPSSFGGVPTFVSKMDANSVFETAQCIQFMRQHHPEQPLSMPGKLNTTKVGFEWAFEWEDIDRITNKAREYLDSVRDAVAAFHNGQTLPSGASGGNAHETLPVSQDPWLQIDDEDAFLFDRPPPMLGNNTFSYYIRDQLMSAVSRKEEPQSSILFRPPATLLAQNTLRPLIQAQHLLLTTTTLHCMLRTHALRDELHSLHQFHLFSSGTFTTSLTHVLFASTAEAAERRKNVARSGRRGFMGLRLGSGERREWPPTSSELSLALMGVLDTSGGDGQIGSKASGAPAERKDGFELQQGNQQHYAFRMSFALRPDLPADDIEKILDVDSIYALDFLKLVYTPPAALQIIITDAILEKYDRVLKLQLRFLRVKYVLRQLFSDATLARRGKRLTRVRAPAQDEYSASRKHEALIHRFRHRATHFVNTLLTYMRYAGIEAPWTELMAYINSLDAYLSSSATSTSTIYTLATLQATHERTITTILARLFLRRRQRKLQAHLEEICGTILVFTKAASALAEHGHAGNVDVPADAASAAQLYELSAALDKHVRGFQESLAEAAERAEMGKGRRGDVHQEEHEKGMEEYMRALVAVLDIGCR